MSSRSKRGSPESRPWSHGHFDAAAPSRTPKLARFEIEGSSVVTVVIPGLCRPLMISTMAWSATAPPLLWPTTRAEASRQASI